MAEPVSPALQPTLDAPDVIAERERPETRPGLEPDLGPDPLRGTPYFRSGLRFVLRVLIFLTLIGFIVFILHKQMETAFMANPGLNGIIIGVLLVGILMALSGFGGLGAARRAGTVAARDHDPAPLIGNPVMSPLAPALTASQLTGLSADQGAGALESLSLRLDDGRETLRYMAGLLVFLGLLGTFWGLLETVSSIGGVIKSLRSGGEAGVMFDEMKAGLAAPLAGMGLSFSSSLFGIAGSLVLGFLDQQLGQAQRQLRNDAEGWLATLPVGSGAGSSGGISPAMLARLEKLVTGTAASGGAGSDISRTAAETSRAATHAMANLAEGIQGLVQHMRSEQQLIRDWVEAQAQRDREMKKLLEKLAQDKHPPAQPGH
jgi:hypothetical protein